MFTRIVECNLKPGKREEALSKLRNDILPLLKKQAGFVDVIGLTHESDAERLVSVSFWNSKEDAERYNREQYNHIVDILRPLLKTTPTVETYNVETSTVHRIAAGKAA